MAILAKKWSKANILLTYSLLKKLFIFAAYFVYKTDVHYCRRRGIKGWWEDIEEKALKGNREVETLKGDDNEVNGDRKILKIN